MKDLSLDFITTCKFEAWAHLLLNDVVLALNRYNLFLKDRLHQREVVS